MSFTVATWNVNSIRARMHILLPWLDEAKPDVVCLQETKVPNEAFPAEAIEGAGYQAAFRGQKSYNGVAILSRHDIQDIRSGFDDDGEPDEPRLLTATIHGITLVNTYVPQGRDPDHPMFEYKLEWFGRIRRLLEERFSPAEDLLWVGDLNVAPTPIDVWWGTQKPDAEHVCYHPRVTDALDRVMAWGLVDAFRTHHPEPDQYTYYDYRAKGAIEARKGWRIDHILATAGLAERCSDAWIDLEPRRKVKPSDHTPLLATFDFS